MLATEAGPFVAEAAQVYGAAVLAGLPDGSSGEMPGLGCRLLVRVFGSRGDGEPLPGPLAALAADPEDGDALTGVLLAVQQVLAADPIAVADVRSLLATGIGPSQHIVAGRDALVAGRDFLVTNNYYIEDGRSARDRTGRNRFDGLLSVLGPSGRLPRLSELDDEVLGVTPTRYSRTGDSPYVGKGDADEAIRELLAAPGPPYPFVIIWGNTKTGKSRTLVEGLRASMAHDPVVIVPRDGAALVELCQSGVSDLAEGRPAVVVLDDLAPASLEALTAAVLADIRKWAGIAATMTAQRRAEVLDSRSGFSAVARAALDSVSGDYELSDGPPVGIERAEAERLYPAEHFNGTIAETLVGATELVARYKASRDTNPAACALLRAAIDCRRIGFSRPVTESQLWRLFPIYARTVRVGLTPTAEGFAAALEWAAQPVASQVALLRKASRGEEPAWIVLDHAVTADEGHGGHRPRPIPSRLWEELIDTVSPLDSYGIALSASRREESRAAIAAFRKASTSASPWPAAAAAFGLGVLLGLTGDFSGATLAYERSISCEDSEYSSKAAVALGLLRYEQGDVTGARDAYRKAYESGHEEAAPVAAIGLGNILQDEGDLAGARQAYEFAMQSGDENEGPRAAANLGRMLWRQGDTEGARQAYMFAIESGHEEAAAMADHELALLLNGNSFPEDDRAVGQVSASSGDGSPALAAMKLGVELTAQGRLDEAREAYQTAIDSGYADAPLAMVGLGYVLKQGGDIRGAEAAYRQAIATGHPDAARFAASFLEELEE
ncbi:MAG TPA: tetratricopeptide repeat protein [Trebonia sp.]